MDFEQEIDQILKLVPKERRTQLFSATMTSKVARLQRASLTDPVKVEVDSKYRTVGHAEATVPLHSSKIQGEGSAATSAIAPNQQACIVCS